MPKVNTQQEKSVMIRVKVLPDGSISLPAELRQELRLSAGDDLDAEVEDGKLTLRPVGDREAAWKRLMEIVDEDKWIGPEPRPSPEEEEQWIFDAVAEFRERHD